MAGHTLQPNLWSQEVYTTDGAGNVLDPQGITGLANSSPPAAASPGQRVNAWFGLNGQLVCAAVSSNASPGDGSSLSGFMDLATNGASRLPGVGTFVYRGDATWDRQRTPVLFKSFNAQAITAGTPVAIWTPTSGKKFRLMGYALSLSVAGGIIFKDATTVILDGPLMPIGIGQPSPPMGNGILSALANNVLNIDVSASGSVSGWVCGTEE